VVIQALARDTALSVEDGLVYFPVPSTLAGFNLASAHVSVATASSSGTPTFQLHNVTDSEDMLSTAITIDATETDSKDAATAPVVDTDHDDVAHGDILRLDCDVAGTGTKGCYLRLTFQEA